MCMAVRPHSLLSLQVCYTAGAPNTCKEPVESGYCRCLKDANNPNSVGCGGGKCQVRSAILVHSSPRPSSKFGYFRSSLCVLPRS